MVPLQPRQSARPVQDLRQRVRRDLYAARARRRGREVNQGAETVGRHRALAGGNRDAVHALQRRVQPQVEPEKPGHDPLQQSMHRDHPVLRQGRGADNFFSFRIKWTFLFVLQFFILVIKAVIKYFAYFSYFKLFLAFYIFLCLIHFFVF